MAGQQRSQGSTQKDSADLFRRLRLEERLDRFEVAWQTGNPPEIGDYLVKEVTEDARQPTMTGPTRRDELKELVMVDLEYRWRLADDQLHDGSSETVRSGCLPNRPYLEDYVQRYAELGPLEELPMDLIVAEFRVRQRWGESPSLTSYSERFSAHEELPRHLQQVEEDGSLVAATNFRSLLKSSSSFSSLPVAVVDLIESAMREQTFAAGERLMRQGDAGTSLMLICDGVVEISTEDEAGNRHFVDRSRSGEILGEMALLSREPRSAHVTAVTSVRALVLEADTFHNLARRHPEITVILTHVVATRLGRPGRDVLAGKTLGNHQVKQLLGRGGMGVVYEANQLQSGERVALKMMSHRLVYDPEALQRFRLEAEIIESFDHDNIVRMLGRFEAFHTYFIALEFCDGYTLKRIIKQNGALPEEQIRKITGQLASALNCAHAAGVIHRDIKPSNIMLNRDGIVKLMDFGLAKPVDDTAGSDKTVVLGTPGYMAPEQFRGGEVDHTADFFALGCVVFEMLTGKPLFPNIETGRLVEQYANWSTDPLDRILSSISDDLAELLRTALSRDPRDRQLDLNALMRSAGQIDERLFQAPVP